MPQISVIVPVYKVEPYIYRCIDSILAQTFTDFELILVDDGSPDNCGAICDEYATMDSRIHVIHQKNGGLSAARNAGIDWAFANSDSEWLAFVDSDDWVHPSYFEALYHAAQNTGVDIVAAEFKRTSDESPLVDESNLTACVLETEEFFVEHNVTATVAWGKIYKKELFANLRYPVGKIHEDEYLTYKVLFQSDRVGYIREPLYAYYVNDNGIMGIVWSPKRLDAINALYEQIEFFASHGYDEIFRYRVKGLAGNLSGQYASTKANEKYKNEYSVFIRREFRHLRKQYKTLLRVSGNEYIYERFYPHLMGIYWRTKGILERLTKRN